MPLQLVHGPPNSGRAGLVRRRFTADLPTSPVLVLPNLDDVYAFERELSREEGALLGGSIVTFDGLFAEVALAAGLTPARRLGEATRLRLVAAAVRRASPRVLARSAARPGFAAAAATLIEELQSALLDPPGVEAAAGGLEESAYLGELAAIYRAHAELREELRIADPHTVASEALATLRREPGVWGGRPVHLYGFDDLTREQLSLVAALAEAAEVTVAFAYEDRPALAARATLLGQLRELGPAGEEATAADPGNTDSPLLFHLERNLLEPDTAPPLAPDGSLVLLRSAGERGEAEAIGAEIARLLAAGEPADGIAVALRDPVRRGPLYQRVLEGCGIPVAVEADLPLAGTATGGALLALLRAAFTTRTAADVLAHLRGPRRGRPSDVDWLERRILRKRLRTADEAAEAWKTDERELSDLVRLRDAERDPARLLAVVAGLARDIAEWPLAREETQGRMPGGSHSLELRAGNAIATSLEQLAEVPGLEPGPEELIETIAALRMPLWRGPAEGRVRVASPYRLRAGRVRHLFVASLQDGEFPRRGGGSPFLSDDQRAQLGLPERAEVEAEERYLFYTCLSLPTTGLWLSCRVSDESGGAEQPSPLIGEVRRLLDPPPPENGERDPLDETLVRGRALGEVVFPPSDAPSETELARSLAARGPGHDRPATLAALEVTAGPTGRVLSRLDTAAGREAKTRAPGPLSSPAVLDALRERDHFGGTTLEGFAVCSYRWFVSHELSPQSLGPLPEPIAQGSLMHGVLYALYRERPGGDPLPRPGSVGVWIERGLELIAEAVEDGAVSTTHSGDRALRRRVEHLLEAFLRREAARPDPQALPQMLEAGFGEDEKTEKPALDLGGWLLHGSIDRVDMLGGEAGLVQDYKLSSKVTPCATFEDEGKLQLQLYEIALRELWGVEPVGGLYQPLRATRDSRPRGMVRADAADDLDDLRLVKTDKLEPAAFDAELERARAQAGEIVERMRSGRIDRDPIGETCPDWCEYAPICRRERGALAERDDEVLEEGAA